MLAYHYNLSQLHMQMLCWQVWGSPGLVPAAKLSLLKETLQTLTKQCTQVGKINNSIKRRNSQ